jgi:hypothetical protein
VRKPGQRGLVSAGDGDVERGQIRDPIPAARGSGDERQRRRVNMHELDPNAPNEFVQSASRLATFAEIREVKAIAREVDRVRRDAGPLKVLQAEWLARVELAGRNVEFDPTVGERFDQRVHVDGDA